MTSDRHPGHEVLYSDISLKRLALNDTANYYEEYEKVDLTNLWSIKIETVKFKKVHKWLLSYYFNNLINWYQISNL